MLSNPLTTIEDLSNNNLIKLDWEKYLRDKVFVPKYSNKQN